MRDERLNILRGIAAMAVVLDHVLYYFFINENHPVVWQHTLLSVPWFLFISGHANSISFRSHLEKMPAIAAIRRFFIKRGIYVFYYIAATLALCLWQRQYLDSDFFISSLIAFNAHTSFYYFRLLFLSLLIFPVIYFALYSSKVLVRILCAGSLLLTAYAYISLDAYGLHVIIALIPFLLGMLWSRVSYMRANQLTPFIAVVFTIAEIGLLELYWRYIPDVTYGYYFVWSLSMVILLYQLLRIRIVQTLLSPLSVIGKASLLVFILNFPLIEMAVSVFGLPTHPVIRYLFALGTPVLFYYTFAFLIHILLPKKRSINHSG